MTSMRTVASTSASGEASSLNKKVAACHACRDRKTRCVGFPICQHCARNNLICSRSDDQSAPPTPLDQWGQQIINAIHDAKQDLIAVASAASAAYSTSPLPSAPASGSHGWSRLRLPWWTSTVEETLTWSSLRRPGIQRASAITLIDGPLSEMRLLSSFNSLQKGSLPVSSNQMINITLDDVEEMSRFLEKFLENIHVRNPLIEPAFLRNQIAISTEVGHQWDSAACLLLIICACGAVASPFNLDTLEDYSKPSISAHDYLSSREYFDAGRKRLGLLGDESSQVTVECLFFTGVYYMCTLRPVAAWRAFHSASIMCRHCLQRTESEIAVGQGSTHQQQRRRSLISRLYWSCVKSEREVAIELGNHPSTTSLVEYDNALPSPPTPPVFNDDMMGSPSSEITSPGSLTFGDRVAANVYEQSWFYYLTDITIRKLEMQVDEAVCRAGELPSDSSLGARESFYQKIIMTLSDADQWITAHYSALPNIIAFDMNEQYHSTNDLPEYLRYRMLATRQNLHRPALYTVLHYPDDVRNIFPSLREQIIAMANRALAFDVYFIRHGLTTHRHPGTWLLIRHVTRCALELLATWRAQSPWLALDPQWKDALESCKGALRYWSAESRDTLHLLEWIEQAQSS